MYNTLLIKRRLATSLLDNAPALSGGELAYSEKSNILYYGSGPAAGPITTIMIGGSGAYVTAFEGPNQDIYGPKTFHALTTLSSTNFVADAVINAGNNAIHQVLAAQGNNTTGAGSAQAGTDAANIAFVQSLSSWLDTYYVNRGVAGQTATQDAGGVKTWKDDGYFQKQVYVTGMVTASAGHFTDAVGTALQVDGNAIVNGNLTVLGTTTQLDTQVKVTSAMDITNTGSGPALTVTQTGAVDIALFKDDANTALVIKDGGNVGIGLDTPAEKLTVVGNVSASGNYTGVNALFNGTLNVSGAGAFASDVTVFGNLSGNTSTGVPISRLEGWIVDCGTF